MIISRPAARVADMQTKSPVVSALLAICCVLGVISMVILDHQGERTYGYASLPAHADHHDHLDRQPALRTIPIYSPAGGPVALDGPDRRTGQQLRPINMNKLTYRHYVVDTSSGGIEQPPLDEQTGEQSGNQSRAAVNQTAAAERTDARQQISRRSASEAKNEKQQTMLHSHLSRKVFERACAASKDTIDEIIKCVLDSNMLIKTLGKKATRECYKSSFGADYMDGDVDKHKELICNNRDKFEELTACVYKSTSESMSAKEMDKFTESLVDVGLCIINALDG